MDNAQKRLPERETGPESCGLALWISRAVGGRIARAPSGPGGRFASIHICYPRLSTLIHSQRPLVHNAYVQRRRIVMALFEASETRRAHRSTRRSAPIDLWTVSQLAGSQSEGEVNLPAGVNVDVNPDDRPRHPHPLPMGRGNLSRSPPTAHILPPASLARRSGITTTERQRIDSIVSVVSAHTVDATGSTD